MNGRIKLLYFSSNEWGNLGRRKVRLAYEFSRQEEAAAVLYANPAVRSSVLDVARRRFEPSHLGDDPRAHADALLGRSRQAEEGLWIYTGSKKTLPLTRSERLRRSPILTGVNRWLYVAGLRRQIRRLPGDQLVVWLSHPLQVELLGAFPERRLACYDWTDDWVQFSLLPVADRSELERASGRVLRSADIVFAVSESLYQRAVAVNAHTYRAPNATDFELLSPPGGMDLPVHPELRSIPRPRLGYVGQIGENIDFALVRAIAEARRDWSFVFVGPIWATRKDEVAGTGRLGNVHFLGGKPHSELPEFFRGFDVCLMPHVHSPLTASMDPTKLYDYLASGRPIVSTSVAGTERFLDVVYIGDGPQEFVVGIEDALRENGGRMLRRLDYAQQNSWPRRATEMWNEMKSTCEARMAEP